MTSLAESSVADPAFESALPRVRARIAALMAEHHLPGVTAGIVRDQRLVWSEGFGLADVDAGRAMTDDAVFRVASISKTFTATGIMQLRDAGRLRLDDPLVAFIPEFGSVQCRHGRVEDVTFRRLLSHRSGLMTEGPFSYWDTREFPSMDEVLAAMPRTEVVIPPSSATKYSNLAFALMGEVITRLSGQPFAEYMRAAIFEPLGMTSSSFAPDDALLARMATGYRAHPFEDYPTSAGHAPANGIAAAAGLYTTVPDLARWLSLQFREDGAADQPVLAGASLAEMHQPQVMNADWTDARCLGWMGMRRGERVFVGHGGSIHGFITRVLFSVPRRTGVIVLTNEGRHDVANLTAVDALEILMQADEQAARETPPPVPLPTPSEWRRFLGRYSLTFGGLVNVECRAGALRLAEPAPTLTSLHAPARLDPTDEPHVFRVTEGRANGELLTFDVADDGAVRGFTLAGFRYHRGTESPGTM
jgi:CubicO group peptidase (beta-lactamase class C family)